MLNNKSKHETSVCKAKYETYIYVISTLKEKSCEIMEKLKKAQSDKTKYFQICYNRDKGWKELMLSTMKDPGHQNHDAEGTAEGQNLKDLLDSQAQIAKSIRNHQPSQQWGYQTLC